MESDLVKMVKFLWGYSIIQIVIVMGFTLIMVPFLTWVERKVIGHMQVRLGPMRVGYHGILQGIADGLKLLLKENIVPSGADRSIFILAPIISLVPALIAFSVIPFDTWFYITDINIAVLYVLAVSSVGTYGIILAGWSSNSKYALLGALRSAAQVISYELAIGMALVGPLMLAGTFSLVGITKAQTSHWFLLPQIVAFFVYYVAMLAETNRSPFDLPEAETELVAGFHVEYSGMRFAYFFIAEYANMMLVSSMATVVFLGGWNPPFQAWEAMHILKIIPGVLWFFGKMMMILVSFVWVRSTFPRFRYDQLMRLGWKVLIPLALANIVVTGIVLAIVG
ncbi:MAG: NADH-quinone oxidoreductase subunit NuoH [bacterium]